MKITGKIIHGAGRGRALGFPTINLDSAPADLSFGVYAAWVTLSDKRFLGAVNYGPQPTFSGKNPILEVFILDFPSGEDWYGKNVTVEIVKKIREIKKFASVEELKLQIQRDVEEIRASGL